MNSEVEITVRSPMGLGTVHVVACPRLDEDLIALACQTATPAISDACPTAASMDPNIMSMAPGSCLAGTALTVALPPGDNLLLHIAIRLLQLGQVLVVSTGIPPTWTGPFGDLMRTSASVMGAAGAVIDGYVRDGDELADGAFPVFARGVTPRACGKQGGGEINGSIICGGVPVNPGDLIVADDNGIVVVPQSDGSDAIRAAQEKMQREVKRRQSIMEGNVSPAFLEPGMREVGLEDLLELPIWNRKSGEKKDEST